MLLAFAVLLIHPQLAVATSFTPDKVSSEASGETSASNSPVDIETSVPGIAAPFPFTTQPPVAEAEAKATLPDAPVPVSVSATPAHAPFIKAASPMVVSVKELQAEKRRKLLIWRGLAIASSGAATFDALTTRYAITTTGARELDPLLRPFAGNSSLFAAIQVAPALLDFAGRKMMYSRYSLLRKTWWMPQSGSFVVSMFCGSHNLAYH
jgi:hypothetical protein